MIKDSSTDTSTDTSTDGTSSPAESPGYEDRVLGCLLGTMAGDAYGTLHATGVSYPGPALAPGAALGDPAAVVISDATSLTLYTVDGLIEALEWANDGVAADETACLWLAYLRWLERQGEHLPPNAPTPPPRWLDQQSALQPAPHPDPDTVRALLTGEMGTRSRPLNARSAGPGALMRSAPFGLVPRIPASMVERLTVDGAHLTHGTSGATEPAATYSGIIRSLVIEGSSLAEALGRAEPPVPDSSPSAAPTAAGTLDAAVEGVRAGAAAAASPDEQFAQALTQAISAAGPDASPVIAASLAGGIMGALHGTGALPASYLSSSGIPGVVRTMTRTLVRATTGA